MRDLILLLMLCPLYSFTEPGAQDYKLSWLLLIIIILLLALLFFREKERKGIIRLRLPFLGRRLMVDLLQDRRYRPRMLTLVIKNNSRKDIDVEAPVILFRKLLLKRKFKLKGIDRNVIYPLYLEPGKVHELFISLSAFHEYDTTLKKYYWARVEVTDSSGKKYQTRYVTLRKSLFS